MLFTLSILAFATVASCDSSLQPVNDALRRNDARQAAQLLKDAAPSCTESSNFFALSGVTNEFLGKPNEAEASFLRAIDADPGSVQLREQLGAIYLRHKKPSEARTQLEQVLSREPGNEAVKRYLIGAYVGTGAWQPAAKLFDQIGGRAAIGNEPVLLVWYAQTLAQTGQFARLERDLPANTLPPAVLFSTGSALAQTSQFEKAILYWEAIPAEARDDAVFFNLGLAHSHLQKFDLARSAYFQAIDKRPDHVEAYFRIGLDFGRLGQGSKAIPWLSRAHQLDPSRQDITYSLAEQLIELRYTETAGQILIQTPEGGPNGQLMQVAEADLRFANGDAPGAMDRYAAVLRSDPGFVPALVGLAKAERKSGRDDEARANLLKACAADPHNPEAAGQLGLLDFDGQRWTSAETNLTLAWSQDKTHLAIALTLARALLHLNKAQDALNVLDPLRASAAQDFAFHLALAQIYTQLHRSTMAEAERAAASRLQTSDTHRLRFESPKTYVQ